MRKIARIMLFAATAAALAFATSAAVVLADTGGPGV